MERITLRQFTFDSKSGRQYPREFMIHQGAVKLSETETEVRIAVVEGSAEAVFNTLSGFHMPKTARFFTVSKADFAAFIGETTPVTSQPGGAAAKGSVSYALDMITSDAPIINIINAICIEAIRLGASDIHIEAFPDGVHIRYRIDGVLRTVKTIDALLFVSLANRIKIMADMNTLEQRMPQDGRMTVRVGDVPVDLRVSIVPTTSGESIVLRLFNKATELLGIDQLGFDTSDLAKICGVIRQPYGLILLTGPTGSGKTTTLHALLRTLPAEELKIVTIEDPVEQLLPGINQIQIHDAIQITFDGMLRRVLRQDPNVIMVGEIRDIVTAEIALRSALTGHLILSTLHTNDSISVIPRLTNIGIEPYLIAAVLRCSTAQRLVRRVCAVCSRDIPMDKRMAQLCKKHGIAGGMVKEAVGCEACHFTGYKGRTILGEIFLVDSVIEEMIANRKSAGDIAAYAQKQGMTTIAEDALRKLAAGVTTRAELEREVIF